MARYKLKAGSTGRSVSLFVQDSTTGLGLGALVYNTAGLTARYKREGQSSWTTISLVTMTVGTWTSGGFVANGGQSGSYDFGVPNAVLASGALSATIEIFGATGMLLCLLDFELDAIDYQDATRAGLAALPNAASGTAGAVVTSGTGTAQLATNSGQVLIQSGTGAGQVSLAAGAVLLQATQTGVTIPTVTNLTNAPTNGDFTSTMKSSLNAATPSVTVSDKTGFSLSAPGVAAIWAAAVSGLVTVGSIGKLLADFVGIDTSGITTLLARLTTSRASWLDNLSGGPVATHADVLALNQSASRRVLLHTVSQYERPETGSPNVNFEIQLRTFNADGPDENASVAPTLTATGLAANTNLSGKLTGPSNPATGVYRWLYSVTSADVNEQIRFNASATMSDGAFSMECYSQVVDEVALTFTPADRGMLIAINDNQAPLNSAVAALPGLVTTSVTAQITSDHGSGSYLRNTEPASDTTIANKVDQVLTLAHGGGAWNVSGGGGGGGTGDGARTVTISVNDGTWPVQSATVRVSKGLETYVTSANAAGVVSFNLDDGQWQVAITRPGYQFAGVPIEIAADVAQSYTMTPVIFTPSNVGRTTGILYAYDPTGNVLVNYPIAYRITKEPKGKGAAFDRTLHTSLSSGAGLVECVNMVKGAEYEIQAGTQKPITVKVPEAAGETFQLPNMIFSAT